MSVSNTDKTPADSGDLAQNAKPKYAWPLFIGLAIFITAADLWSKHAVFEFLEVKSISVDGGPPHIDRTSPPKEHPVIEGYFHLEANYNYGAFNGWFSEHTGALAILSLAALFVISGILFFSLKKNPPPGFFFIAALGLVAGGTAGNFYDRYFLRGVRDWIKWFYVDANGQQHVWPNFNIADAGICIGVCLLIVIEFAAARREHLAAKAKSRD